MDPFSSTSPRQTLRRTIVILVAAWLVATTLTIAPVGRSAR